MCTSRAFWLPSGCGIAPLPRKVPSLMSAIEAFTTATILASSVSVSLSSAPSLDLSVSTLPSAFSIVPRTRRVCAVTAHDAAIIAPTSSNRIVLIMSFLQEGGSAPSRFGGAYSIRQVGPVFPQQRVNLPFDGSKITRHERNQGLPASRPESAPARLRAPQRLHRHARPCVRAGLRPFPGPRIQPAVLDARRLEAPARHARHRSRGVHAAFGLW